MQTLMDLQPVYCFSHTNPDPHQYNHLMMVQQRYVQEHRPPDNLKSAWDDEDRPENYSPAKEDHEDHQENIPPREWDDEDDDQTENYSAADEESDEPRPRPRPRPQPRPLSVLMEILHDDDEEELDDLDGEVVRIRTMSFLEASERLGQDSNLKEETISKNLKTRQYRASEADQDGDDEDVEICVVCQSEFEDKEILAKLGCGHEYHYDCAKRWLQHKNVCPICKRTAIQQQQSS